MFGVFCDKRHRFTVLFVSVFGESVAPVAIVSQIMSRASCGSEERDVVEEES
jgi:hypothetical protein